MFDMEKHNERIKWYTDARFGMFIHWGLYAIPADGEWIRSNKPYSDEEYMKFFNSFNPTRYNPDEWAEIAEKAGMKYVVLTTKHHDGFCLFDSKYTDFKATNTPAGRDLIREYVDAFRKRGIKIGFYYSLLDWNHPDYPRDRIHPLRKDGVDRSDGVNFKNYVEYLHNQVRELMTNYGKIDILWFDFSYDDMVGEVWEATKLTRMVRELQPEILINARLDAYEYYNGSLGEEEPHEYCGDFIGAECVVPEKGFTDYKGDLVPWECCMTVNDTWSYAKNDCSAKSPKQLVRLLVNSVSKGGNVLLNVGPSALGEIGDDTKNALLEVGKWMKKNGESIYGCTAVDRPRPDNGRLTGKDGKIYYHILEKNASLDALYGIKKEEIEHIRLLADGTEPYSPKGAEHIVPYHYADTVFIDLCSNSDLPDDIDTVIEITLKK